MKFTIGRKVFAHAAGLNFEGLHDVYREVAAPWGSLIVMANAYECGFSTCWPEGSRLLLTEFEKAFDPNSKPEPQLEGAFTRAASTFMGAHAHMADDLGGPGLVDSPSVPYVAVVEIHVA